MNKDRRVDFVTQEAGLEAKVRYSLANTGLFRFIFSKQPIPREDMTAYIVPESVFLESTIMEDLAPRACVIGYGDPALLDIAFCSGCDDYLKDPWTPSEMYTRLSRFAPANTFTTAGKLLSLRGRTLFSEDGYIRLTAHETLVLRTLLKHQGSPVPRDALRLVLHISVRSIPGRSVDMHISSLRKKIRTLAPKTKSPGPIITVRGIGYLFNLSEKN